MIHPHTFPSVGRSGLVSNSGASVEPLEARRLMADVIGRVDLDVFVDTPNEHALPPPALALPRQDLALPRPGGVSRHVGGLDVRGLYTGTVRAAGAGSAPITLDITRQRRGRISGTISSPLLDDPISGTVRITFTGDRRFTFRLGEGDDSVLVSGRINRDGTVTGNFSGEVDGETLRGTFSLTKVGGPGTQVGIIT